MSFVNDISADAVKDLADVRGLPTTMGLWRPDEAPTATHDSDFVARLRSGGALFVGDLLRGSILGRRAHTHFYMCDLQDNADDVREDREDYYEDRYDDWDGYDDDDHELAAGLVVGAVVGAAAASAGQESTTTTTTTTTAATTSASLPCNPSVSTVEGVTYYKCGQQHYVQAYGGSGPIYMPTQPPK